MVSPAGCMVWTAAGHCPEPPQWERGGLLYCDGHKPYERGTLDGPPLITKRYRPKKVS